MGKRSWRFVLFLILGLAGFAEPSFALDKYVIDAVHTHVGFSARHLMVTNVRGNFKEFSGVVFYDKVSPTKSSATGRIKVASIHTGDEKRDGHLRSPDFFDAAKFPEITFKTLKLTQRGDEEGDRYLATGLLTMRGVQKAVAFPIHFLGTRMGPDGKEHLGFEAELSLNRQDYGISWNMALDKGGVVLADHVKVMLDVEAIHE